MAHQPSAGRTPSRASVGVVGAGQLCRMLLEAASPLAIDLRVLAERPDDSAALVATDVALGSPTDPDALCRFAAGVDVLTFDHELVDAGALAGIEAGGHRLRPSAAVVATVQDKLAQRAMLAGHGFPVPPFRPVSAYADLLAFAKEHGWPIVVKATRGGYDGRGVWVLADERAARRLADEIDPSSRRLLVEAHVPIEREVAVLVARRAGGETAVYPVVETVQVKGMLLELVAPAPVDAALAAAARRMAAEIAGAIDVTGVLAIEIFQTGDRLIVNELAARPHNSGHYSIEGCVTSQFEQHLRAVLDWPLGTTDLLAPAVATVNVLGARSGADPRRRLPDALAVPGARVHLYGKAARPGRKLGHVTVLGDDTEETMARARRAAALLTGDEGEGEAR